MREKIKNIIENNHTYFGEIDEGKLLNELCVLFSVSSCFYLVQERKPEKDGEYDVVTKRGRLIKANFIKGDKISLDKWTYKSEYHRLNEGVIAWGYPINNR